MQHYIVKEIFHKMKKSYESEVMSKPTQKIPPLKNGQSTIKSNFLRNIKNMNYLIQDNFSKEKKNRIMIK